MNSQTRAAWVASIIAAFALLISIFSLYESHEARLATVRDNVTFQIGRYLADYPLVVRKANENMTLGAVEVLWEILISNTGGSTVSITGYEIFQVDPQGGQMMYSGMDKGIFSAENRAQVSLPIALEAGKSTRLLLKVAISPGKRAYKILSTTIEKEQKTLTLKSAEKILAMNGTDLYDNVVVPLDPEATGWKVEKQGNEQTFMVKFYTARGAEISKLTSWYDLKKLQ